MVLMVVLEQTANNFLNYLFSLKTIFGWRLVKILLIVLKPGTEMFCWVMIICSKFVCSKNLLDTIFCLLDTIWANVTFFVNCLKIKNHEKSSAVRVFRAVSLLDKKILTARIAIGRQRFWKMSTAQHNL
jgi:hypothetical protein